MNKLAIQQALTVPFGVVLTDWTVTQTFERREGEDWRTGMLMRLPPRHADFTFKAEYNCPLDMWPSFEKFLREHLGRTVQSYGTNRIGNALKVYVDAYAGRVNLDTETELLESND